MNTTQAATIIEALADGIDPSTGEILMETSPFNNVDVVRALNLALKALSKLSDFDVDPEAIAERNGKPWTPAEEEALRKAFTEGQGSAAIMAAHRRSSGGISSRLVKLGLITERREFRAK